MFVYLLELIRSSLSIEFPNFINKHVQNEIEHSISRRQVQQSSNINLITHTLYTKQKHTYIENQQTFTINTQINSCAHTHRYAHTLKTEHRKTWKIYTQIIAIGNIKGFWCWFLISNCRMMCTWLLSSTFKKKKKKLEGKSIQIVWFSCICCRLANGPVKRKHSNKKIWWFVEPCALLSSWQQQF